jgi:hypothetical protein
MWTERMSWWCVGDYVGGRCRNLFTCPISEFASRGRANTRKRSVRIAGSPDEIRTRYLQNTNRDRYRYTNLLGHIERESCGLSEAVSCNAIHSYTEISGYRHRCFANVRTVPSTKRPQSLYPFLFPTQHICSHFEIWDFHGGEDVKCWSSGLWRRVVL